MKELYEEMRESSEKKTWARGLELSRQNQIFDLGYSNQVRNFVVREQAKAVDYAVTLDSLNLDWSCTCLEAESPCSHSVASVLAWRQESEGRSIPHLHDSKWTLSYIIEPLNGALYVKRSLVRKDEIKPLPMSLQSLKSHISNSSEISARNSDLELDRVLGESEGEGEGDTHRLSLSQFSALQALEVKFRDKEIQFDRTPRGLSLWIRKEGGGVSIKLENESGEVFQDFILMDSTIYPLVKLPFSPSDEQSLRSGKYLGAKESLDFMSRSLPRFKSLMPVYNQGADSEKMIVQVGIQSWENEASLFYKFLLVYGDPVLAFLEGEDLSTMGSRIPIRSRDEEYRVLVEFERATGQTLDRVYRVDVPEAFEVARRFFAGRYPLLGGAIENFATMTEGSPKLTISNSRFVFSLGNHSYSHKEIAARLSSGGAFRQKDGRWLQMSRAWLEGEGKKVMDILLMNGDHATSGSVLSINKFVSFQDKDSEFHQLILDWDKVFPVFQSPIHLRPYQLEGAKWLAKLQNLKLGGILADEMGLGKTYQTLLSLSTPSLVVAPTSLLGNWLREARQARPELNVGVLHGPSRDWDLSFDIYITSYGTVRSDMEKLKEIPFKTAVLDEAQNIKNPHAKTSVACFSLTADSRIALSGTPFENSISDLWSLMNFCVPGLLGTFDYFKAHYSKPEDVIRLKQNISPFVLRRLKSDVALQLPEKSVQVVRCTMESDQRDFYTSLLGKIKTELVNAESSMSILTGLLRLRQAACDPFLVDSSSSAGSSKLEYLVEALGELHQNGQAALVFSQWTSLLDRLESRLKSLGLGWSRLDGATADREGAVREFMGGETSIFLISLKAGGTGLNLTRADHVFILDPWWNPAVEEQAMARAHRMGREGKVFVHRLVCEETVEEKIVDLQMEKTEQARLLLEDSDLSSQLKLADLKKLIFS